MKLGFRARSARTAAPNEIQFNRVDGLRTYLSLTHIGDHTRTEKPNGETQMTNMKTLSAVIILSAAVATPVFAQDAGVPGPGSGYGFRPQPGPTYHGRAYDRWNFRGAYDQSDGPFYATPYFGFGGMDRSWVGGEDPSRRPPS